jgi:hypothetical protein
MPTVFQNVALPFRKLSAFVCRIEILRDFTLFNVAFKRRHCPLLDALRRLMPSVGVEVVIVTKYIRTLQQILCCSSVPDLSCELWLQLS